jgi:hypothetical protein
MLGTAKRSKAKPMSWEIWDIESGNCVGRFDNERAALSWVQSLVDSFGSGYADDLVVGIDIERDDDAKSWSGQALLARLADAHSRKAAAVDEPWVFGG